MSPDPHEQPEDEQPDLDAQLRLAMDIPGYVVEVDPDDADDLCAFQETALSDEEAWDAAFDLNWEVDHG